MFPYPSSYSAPFLHFAVLFFLLLPFPPSISIHFFLSIPFFLSQFPSSFPSYSSFPDLFFLPLPLSSFNPHPLLPFHPFLPSQSLIPSIPLHLSHLYFLLRTHFLLPHSLPPITPPFTLAHPQTDGRTKGDFSSCFSWVRRRRRFY